MDPAPTALAGAVLAGGRSTRIGTDKAVLEVAGLTLVERAVAACRGAGASPVAVVGHRATATLPVTLDARIVADLHPGEGPLGGIVTALRWSPAPVVLVIACDLPFLGAALLADLVGRRHLDGADVALARGPAGPEPLVGAWRAGASHTVSAAFDRGVRAVHHALAGLRVVTVDVADPLVVSNVNRPSDLDAARGGADPVTGAG
jgi:molybdenum cofactor guanylyltransferase